MHRDCEGDLAGEVVAIWECHGAGWGHPSPAWNRQNEWRGEEGKRRKEIKQTNMYEDTIPDKSTLKCLGRVLISKKGAFPAKFGVTPEFFTCREAATVQPL